MNITSSTVAKQARKLSDSSGPSGSDANHWFDTLIRFGLESSRLRDLVSQIGNLIGNEIISWRKIKALFSCRLIALDKQPGVRRIGIGETLRRLLGKAVTVLTGDDLAYAFGLEPLSGECYVELKDQFMDFESCLRKSPPMVLVCCSNGIGAETTMKEIVHKKIKNWQAKIQILSAAADFCPHESFSVFTKSVQAEWNFLERVKTSSHLP